MSEPENFLERWSRRKAGGRTEAADQPERAPAKAADPVQPSPVDAASPNPATEAEVPTFDIASLPSLDSITAATDVRAFLAPGVPAELTRAALRRAWTADPAIRDFRGLQENDWDFNDPNGVPGFGQFAPGEDIKRLIAQVFGQPEREPAGSNEPVATTEISPVECSPQQTKAGRSPQKPDAELRSEMSQRTTIAAAHNEQPRDEAKQPPSPRKHGSALPR